MCVPFAIKLSTPLSPSLLSPLCNIRVRVLKPTANSTLSFFYPLLLSSVAVGLGFSQFVNFLLLNCVWPINQCLGIYLSNCVDKWVVLVPLRSGIPWKFAPSLLWLVSFLWRPVEEKVQVKQRLPLPLAVSGKSVILCLLRLKAFRHGLLRYVNVFLLFYFPFSFPLLLWVGTFGICCSFFVFMRLVLGSLYNSCKSWIWWFYKKMHIFLLD